MSWLIWAIMLISLAIVVTMPRESGIRTLVASIILRFIFSFGPEPTLWLLGSVTVLLKGVHIVSLMGNHGTLEKHFLKIICDAQLLYHFGYMIFCLSGILVHPFFYSVLVRVEFDFRFFGTWQVKIYKKNVSKFYSYSMWCIVKRLY